LAKRVDDGAGEPLADPGTHRHGSYLQRIDNRSPLERHWLKGQLSHTGPEARTVAATHQARRLAFRTCPARAGAAGRRPRTGRFGCSFLGPKLPFANVLP